MGGVIRGIGRGYAIFKEYFFSYYIIGMPAGLFFGAGLKLELLGFWFGFKVAVIVMFLFVVYEMSHIDVKSLIRNHDKLQMTEN